MWFVTILPRPPVPVTERKHTMGRVLIFPTSFGKFSDEPGRILEDAGLTYTRFSKPGITEDEMIEKLQGFDAVILGLEPMSEKVMRGCPQLKVVSLYGVGMDNVDLPAARELGIRVYNTPGSNAEAVADYTFGLMLSLARNIPAANRELKGGAWKRYPGRPVYNATLGIIGLGNIGKAVARRARGFGMRILACGHHWDEAFVREYGVEKVSLEELCARADFITLHTSLTPENRNLISMEQFRIMKPTAYLINCARGGLVNETDLAEALRAGLLAGAALDAYAEEPPLGSPLLEMEQVIATPHIAGSSTDSIHNMAMMSARNCVKGLLEAAAEAAPN